MGGTNNDDNANVIEHDQRVLNDLMAAAALSPPIDRYNTDYSRTDGLVELLKRESVRGALFRLRDLLLPTEDERRQVYEAAADLLPTENERLKARGSWADPLSWGYAWWGTIGQTRDDYLRVRTRCVALLQALLAKIQPEPWLPIDEAAQGAGWPTDKSGRCHAARRAAKWKRQDPLPTQKVRGRLHARVSDCVAWLPKQVLVAAAYKRREEIFARQPRNTPERGRGGFAIGDGTGKGRE